MKLKEVNPMQTFYKKLGGQIITPLLIMILSAASSWGAATPMPEFQLPGVGDSPATIRAQDFQGKVLLVNLWATWCPPCRREIPSLIRLQNENQDNNFTVIGISMDTSGRDKVEKFTRKIRINYPVALGNNDVSADFGAQGAIPSSFLVDTNGIIVKRYPGYVPYETMAKDVQELLH
ncbi:MAG: TlpA disulfide reductase family protein [Desulfobulbaceae bacterium]|nr:TlpA disulfide reductase family protein [Desulfobulbaceae bacterium]